MDKTQVTVYLIFPIPSNDLFNPYYDTSDKARAALDDTLSEISTVSDQIEYPYIESEIYGKPTFEVVELADLFGTELEKEVESDVSQNYRFMRVSVSGSPTGELESETKISEAEKAKILKLFFRQDVQKQISDLLVMASISRVGSLILKNSLVVQDGKLHKHSTVSRVDGWALQAAVAYADSIGWPSIHTLTFLEVWEWFTRYEFCPGGFSRCSTGRALNALSNLLDSRKQGGPEQLLWSLVGIEAIYSKGKVGLIEQVKEKSQAFLGQQATYKKEIGRMYDFRSRFVHGDLDFPGHFPVDESKETLGKYEQGLSRSNDLATAMLTATIQELIRRDWKGLDFSYAVSDMEAP